MSKDYFTIISTLSPYPGNTDVVPAMSDDIKSMPSHLDKTHQSVLARNACISLCLCSCNTSITICEYPCSQPASVNREPSRSNTGNPVGSLDMKHLKPKCTKYIWRGCTAMKPTISPAPSLLHHQRQESSATNISSPGGEICVHSYQLTELRYSFIQYLHMYHDSSLIGLRPTSAMSETSRLTNFNILNIFIL